MHVRLSRLGQLSQLGQLARLRQLVAVVAALALLGGLGHGAQTAAQDDGAGGSAVPLIGTPVPIIGADGAEVARITVTGIEDPWDAFEEGSEPSQSFRYVLLRLEIENTSSRPYPIGSFGLGLQDSEGFLSLPSFLPRTAEQIEDDPDLPFDDVPPGETVGGVLGYQVLDSAELVRVTYQPAYDRLIFLADLTRDGSPSGSSSPASPTTDDDDAEEADDAGAEDADGAASGGPSDADDDADDGASGGPSDADADADADTDTDTAASDVSDDDCDAIQAWVDDITPALDVFGAAFDDLAAQDPITAETLEETAADLRDAADDIRASDPPDLLGDSADLLADAIDAYADAYLDVAEANDELSTDDFFSTLDTSAADELLIELETASGPALDACGIES